MNKTQKMLDEAISLYGLGDIVTKMLSQKRDKEVVEEQRKIFENYNKRKDVYVVL